MADLRRQKRTSRLSAAISAVLHGIIIGVLVFVAAREGMLGKQLKKITVTMVPKDKPQEKPKEKPPEPKPTPVAPKTELPKTADVPASVVRPPPAVAAAPASAAPPAAAPPLAALPAFDFEGGKAVESTSDPKVIYKGYVEYTLRSRWTRPEGIADENYVAEAELQIDRDGRVLASTWKRGSGDEAWDKSVRKALADTPAIGRPPPKGFPPQVLVRFDVLPATELPLE